MKHKKNVWKVVAVVAIALWLVTMALMFFLRDKDRRAAEAGAETEVIVPVELKVGDTFTFGNYNGEDIEWWVVDIQDGIATFLAHDVVTMKGFEGAESGQNFYTKSGETKTATRPFTAVENMEAFGSNDWEISSLRAWLNSSKTKVDYIGQKPEAKTMCDGRNEYVNEAGFLKGFTEDELAALVPTEISTEYHDWESGQVSTKVTSDLVYIPCKADIALFEEADVSIYCKPTAGAIATDNSGIYEDRCEYYNLTTSYWWLRDPVEDSYSELYCVATGHNSEMFGSEVAAVAGTGVRPMVRVDISKLSYKEKN